MNLGIQARPYEGRDGEGKQSSEMVTESGDFTSTILCGLGAARSESQGTTVYFWLSDFSEVRIITIQWDLGAKALVNRVKEISQFSTQLCFSIIEFI